MEIDTVSMDGQIYRHLTGIPSLVLRPINTSSARGQIIFLSQMVLLYFSLGESLRVQCKLDSLN